MDFDLRNGAKNLRCVVVAPSSEPSLPKDRSKALQRPPPGPHFGRFFDDFGSFWAPFWLLFRQKTPEKYKKSPKTKGPTTKCLQLGGGRR